MKGTQDRDTEKWTWFFVLPLFSTQVGLESSARIRSGGEKATTSEE